MNFRNRKKSKPLASFYLQYYSLNKRLFFCQKKTRRVQTNYIFPYKLRFQNLTVLHCRIWKRKSCNNEEYCLQAVILFIVRGCIVISFINFLPFKLMFICVVLSIQNQLQNLNGYTINQRLSRACIIHLVIKRTNWSYVKTMSCSGSHLGITINIKNTKFVKDLPMIDAQFRFNQCNSFREEYISVFSPYGPVLIL